MNNLEFKKGLSYLSNNDPILEKIIKKINIDPPHKRKFDFSAFVSVIINQQLTGQAAKTIRQRVIDLCDGELNISNFQKLSKDELIKCGVSQAKYNYIYEISKFISNNPDFFRKVKKMDLDELITTLNQFRGIGLWSSNIIALFYIGHMNVFPYGDVTLQKSISKLYDVEKTNIDRVVINWSPYKSVASVCLWRWFDAGANNLN